MIKKAVKFIQNLPEDGPEMPTRTVTPRPSLMFFRATEIGLLCSVQAGNRRTKHCQETIDDQLSWKGEMVRSWVVCTHTIQGMHGINSDKMIKNDLQKK